MSGFLGIMKSQPTSVNIYADESSIDNLNAQKMVIGAVFLNRKKVPKIKENIDKIREKFFIKGELKWIKTSSKALPFYKELFDYLFSLSDKDFNFKCITIKRVEIDYDKYHDGDRELAFYKFYYELLKNRLEANNTYHIFLDFKPSKSKDRVRRIGEFLSMVNHDANIKHIQAYSSKDNVFIQIADILTGAVGYINYEQVSKNKKELVEIIAKAVGKDNLNFCSLLNSDKKFNIFCIKPGYGKSSE